MAGRYKTPTAECIYSEENHINVLPTEGSGQQLSAAPQMLKYCKLVDKYFQCNVLDPGVHQQ